MPIQPESPELRREVIGFQADSAASSATKDATEDATQDTAQDATETSTKYSGQKVTDEEELRSQEESIPSPASSRIDRAAPSRRVLLGYADCPPIRTAAPYDGLHAA